jgi:hypothetical protein
MEFEAAQELAMILPLPVKQGVDPRQFEFIDLSGYPEFFEDLASGFPTTPPAASASAGASPTPSNDALAVVSVGNFEASFVPALNDFARLDPRFRIDPKLWKSLPGYDRMSFAVFKLKPGRQKLHPMSFSFPRNNPAELFFPTLHIHDGKIHQRERFDHQLYCQGYEHETPDVHNWEESRRWAGQFAKAAKTRGLLVSNAHVYRKSIIGIHPNQDMRLKMV